MRFARWSSSLLMIVVVGFAMSSVGCHERKKKKDDANAQAKHDEWWCQEHGVPEEVCSLCNKQAAAKFQDEKDWCKIHNRAQSQCFKCDPSKYEAFEAQYVAKYGKKPERPPEDEFKK